METNNNNQELSGAILVNQVENKPKRNEKGQLLPGNTANPYGRPKGQSLKEFWRMRLADMDEKNKLEFSRTITKETTWKMAEGNPKNDLDVKGHLTISDYLDQLEDGQKITEQTMENQQPLQDQEQKGQADSVQIK
mgnify:CR=1 FL=1